MTRLFPAALLFASLAGMCLLWRSHTVTLLGGFCGWMLCAVGCLVAVLGLVRGKR